MDINSTKNEEQLEVAESIDESSGLEVKFDEVFNADSIQKQLQEDIADGIEFEEVERHLETIIEKMPIAQSAPTVKYDSNIKKYVIYVEQENIEYMEGLSAEERKSIINSILREQNKISQKEKEFKQRRKFIAHLMLACVTFVIVFPLMFVLVNKSARITIENYIIARDNFSKLYQEQGKIKMKH